MSAKKFLLTTLHLHSRTTGGGQKRLHSRTTGGGRKRLHSRTTGGGRKRLPRMLPIVSLLAAVSQCLRDIVVFGSLCYTVYVTSYNVYVTSLCLGRSLIICHVPLSSAMCCLCCAPVMLLTIYSQCYRRFVIHNC